MESSILAQMETNIFLCILYKRLMNSFAVVIILFAISSSFLIKLLIYFCSNQRSCKPYEPIGTEKIKFFWKERNGEVTPPKNKLERNSYKPPRITPMPTIYSGSALDTK